MSFSNIVFPGHGQVGQMIIKTFTKQLNWPVHVYTYICIYVFVYIDVYVLVDVENFCESFILRNIIGQADWLQLCNFTVILYVRCRVAFFHVATLTLWFFAIDIYTHIYV